MKYFCRYTVMAATDASKAVTKLPEGIKPDLAIKWNIDNFSDGVVKGSGLESFRGFNWRIFAESKPFLDNENKDELCFFIETDPHSFSTMWKGDFVVFFHVVNNDSTKNILLEDKVIHSYKCIRSEKRTGQELSFFKDSNEGFLSADGKLTVEALIYIKSFSGFPRKPLFDFSTASDNLSDVTLLIGDKKVYVSKQILALHSQVFHAMFYGGFAEKDKDEIELKDIEYEASLFCLMEFIELLHVIYPSRNEVTKDSAEYLLKLADRFQIACVIDMAEKGIIESGKIPIDKKLHLSDQYALHNLQAHCLSQLKTNATVTAIKKSSVYNNLSLLTVAGLFERLAQIN